MDSNDISLRRSHDFEGISVKNMREAEKAQKLLKEKGISTGLFKEINQFLHSNAPEKQKKQLAARMKDILNEIAPNFSNKSPQFQGLLLAEFEENLDINEIEGRKVSATAEQHARSIENNLLSLVFPDLFPERQ